jgi:hypothetical protein
MTENTLEFRFSGHFAFSFCWLLNRKCLDVYVAEFHVSVTRPSDVLGRIRSETSDTTGEMHRTGFINV